MIAGERHNRLTAVEFSHKDKHYGVYWRFICECGNNVFARPSDVIKGTTKSCGCYKKEWSKRRDNKFRKAFGEAARNALIHTYKRNATIKGLDYRLTTEEFTTLTKQNCRYCGIEPKQEVSNKHDQRNGTYIYNGIDRIDNTQGYIIDNCVPCCGICNVAKNDLTHQQFLQWIQRIIRHAGFQSSSFWHR